MREILFRGKLPDGEWAEGYIVKGNCTYILTAENIHYMCVSVMGHANVDVLPVKPETIGQYTGLLDKNGKRIFEGDIVDHHVQGDILVCRGIINFDERNARYAHQLKTMNPELCLFKSDAWEVIGNIHDNPELIGGKEDV